MLIPNANSRTILKVQTWSSGLLALVWILQLTANNLGPTTPPRSLTVMLVFTGLYLWLTVWPHQRWVRHPLILSLDTNLVFSLYVAILAVYPQALTQVNLADHKWGVGIGLSLLGLWLAELPPRHLTLVGPRSIKVTAAVWHRDQLVYARGLVIGGVLVVLIGALLA